MKKYLLGLLELRKKELTVRRNELENQYMNATATGLSGFEARVEEVQQEMEKIEIYKKQLQDLDLDGFNSIN